MDIRIQCVVVDADDCERLARFWVVMADPEGNEFCVLAPLPADPDPGSVAP